MGDRFWSWSELQKKKMLALKSIRDKWTEGDKLVVYDKVFGTFEEACIIDGEKGRKKPMLVRFVAKRLDFHTELSIDRYDFRLIPMPGEIIRVMKELEDSQKKTF